MNSRLLRATACAVFLVSMHVFLDAQQSPHGGPAVPAQAGPNTNAAGGVVGNPLRPDGSFDPAALVASDILLQRQNETVIAASTRNPDHLLAAANDYRFVDFPDDPSFGGSTPGFFARLIAKVFRRPLPQPPPRRAAASVGGWTGVYRSCDRGASWIGSALPGGPLDSSAASLRSPLKALSNSAPAGSYAETTDPVIVAGPGGRMHLVSLGFIRNPLTGAVSDSRMYYSSYTDRNNLEGGACFSYDYTIEIDRASNYRVAAPFLDKPSMTVDKDGTLYVSYTLFTDDINSRIVVARSTNAGATWSKTQPLLSLGFLRNHGTTTTVDPVNGTVYVAWRLFYQNWPLMVISRSIDRGRTFLPATPISHWWPTRSLEQIIQQLKAAKLQPFDQFTDDSPLTARSLAFPNIVAGVVNGRSKLFAVWQERADVTPGSATFGQPSASGSPRIMLSMSSDGGWTWTPRRAVDAGLRPEHAGPNGIAPMAGPQLQPALSISGTTNPQLLLLYHEAREELAPPYDLSFLSGIERQMDVRIARINPATGQLSALSRQIAEYSIKANSNPVELAETAPGYAAVSRPNLKMYSGGTRAFFGDYATLVPSNVFEHSGSWRWTAESMPSLAIWTDHRDVRFPFDANRAPDINGDWSRYTPVKPGALPVDCSNVGTRNANPYFAEIGGLVAGSPQTFKRLNIQRAFVTYVANRTLADRVFRVTLVPESGIRASFDQFSLLTTRDIQVFARSSFTQTVWVDPNPNRPTGKVRINVVELDPATGTTRANGYRTTMVLNPDPNNDALTSVPTQAQVPPGTNTNISASELHNPQVSAPQVSAFRVSTPQVSAPQVSAPQVSAPQVSATAMPQVSAPQVSAPQVSAPQVSAPQVSATAPGEPPNGTDVTFTVTNVGNTETSYEAFLNVPNVDQLLNSGNYAFQLLITRTSLVPAFVQTAAGCAPAAETKVQVLANIQIPNAGSPQISAIKNPQVSAPQVSAIATFSVAPTGGAFVPPPSDDALTAILNDEVKVVLRAIRLTPVTDGGPTFDPNAVEILVRSESTNVINGVVQPPNTAPSASPTPAPGFVVTNPANSGAGTLRQAILDANASDDVNTISFALPAGAQISPISGLPAITSPVIIDGTTQPGFSGTPIVRLNGSGAEPGVHGLHLTAGNSTIRGLAVTGFPGNGILIEENGNNRIEGNYFGTDGTTDQGNAGNGIQIVNTANNVIGGTTAATRNVVSGNGGEGIRVDGAHAANNVIRGNFVGTNAAGTAAIGNAASGVFIRRAPGNQIVGNVVSGNRGFAGVAVCGTALFCGGGEDQGTPADADGNVVQGNLIGLAANGIGNLGNNGYGVSLDGAPNTMVGGTDEGQANTIWYNGFNDEGGGLPGVVVFGIGAEGNQILRNSIHANFGLGIDLGADGVTANDAGDGDGGVNLLQNFPVLTSAVSVEGLTTLQGTFNGAGQTSVVIDFYASETCDVSGFGEGQTFVGTVTDLTNADGNFDFTVPLSPSPAVGTFVTAVATTAAGTSEFSGCRIVLPPNFVDFAVADGGNGHVYEYVPLALPGTSWTSARDAATARTFRSVAGRLVTITSAQENAVVNSLINQVGALAFRPWIGASSSAETPLTFGWITGEAFAYTNWAPGEPNGLFPNEFYVEMFGDGRWNNIDLTTVQNGGPYNRGYIVEYAVIPNLPPPGPPPIGAPDEG